MNNYYDIIRQPVNTEKSNIQQETFNQVTFEVAKTANRIEIKKAVEALFKVNVDTVKTIQVKGKKKQRGRISGQRRDWKKAIVKLMPGHKIELFEGV